MDKNRIRLEDVAEGHRDLRGKTVVFTGGSDGMGLAAVRKLGSMGARLILTGRNEEKTRGVIRNIGTAARERKPDYIHLDLSSQSSVRRAAAQILNICPRIDILINCAGASFDKRTLTGDGMEGNWAVNHLGSFLLTQLLLDRLKESGSARIVNLSSDMQKYGRIRFDDIQSERGWTHLKTYAQAKLAMIMCTRRLARELEGTGVCVNAMNPGFIKTNLISNLTGFTSIGKLYMRLCASPPELGGDRIITLAIAPQYEGVSGAFIHEDRIALPRKEALDEKIVDKVWELSREHTGLSALPPAH